MPLPFGLSQQKILFKVLGAGFEPALCRGFSLRLRLRLGSKDKVKDLVSYSYLLHFHGVSFFASEFDSLL